MELTIKMKWIWSSIFSSYQDWMEELISELVPTHQLSAMEGVWSKTTDRVWVDTTRKLQHLGPGIFVHYGTHMVTHDTKEGNSPRGNIFAS